MSNPLEAIAFGLGTTELLIIMGILLLLFGASRIPELGRSLGSGIRGFQRSLKGQDESDQPKQLEASADADEADADNLEDEDDENERAS